MNLPEYTELLNKISYMEGILRMVENYDDPLPLKLVLKDPDLAEIIRNHFLFENANDFIRAFTNKEQNFHAILDKKFKGQRILFHARKHRSSHQLPNPHLIYCFRGRCAIRVDTKELIINEGEAVLIKSGITHAYYNISETSITVHVVLTKAFISSVLLPRLPQEYKNSSFLKEAAFSENQSNSYTLMNSNSVNETSFFLTSAFYHHLYKTPLYEETVNNYITLFFIYMYHSELMSKTNEPFSSTPQSILKNILDCISSNCRDISLGRLAEMYHFNESYMSQYLKHNTGENFTALLQKARIKQAERYLVSSNMSIVEIADRIGYQNISYFYKIFAKVNNCSPTEYRNKFLTSNQRVIGHES